MRSPPIKEGQTHFGKWKSPKTKEKEYKAVNNESSVTNNQTNVFATFENSSFQTIIDR